MSIAIRIQLLNCVDFFRTSFSPANLLARKLLHSKLICTVVALVVVFSFGGIDRAGAATVRKILPNGKVIEIDRLPNKVRLEYFGQSTDILFVIDDSGSMSLIQDELKRNFNLFLDQLNSLAHYHIGVVTTSCDTPEKCGSLVNGYVTPETQNRAEVISKNLSVGVDGSWRETPLDSLHAATSRAKSEGFNKGFLRDHAAFLTVIVTDAEDQSTIGGEELARGLLALKAESSIFAHGIMVTANNNICKRDVYFTKAIKLETFIVDWMKGSTSSICSSNFGQELADIARKFTGLTSRRIPLMITPKEPSLHLYVNGVELLRGLPEESWIYAPLENEIIIGERVDLSLVSEQNPIYVEFIPAAEKSE
jgi:hypothetical protein